MVISDTVVNYVAYTWITIQAIITLVGVVVGARLLWKTEHRHKEIMRFFDNMVKYHNENKRGEVRSRV